MQQRTLLPVVKRGVLVLDRLLLEFAGPIAIELSEDVFTLWLQSGRTRPSDLRHYADLLAAQLEDRTLRQAYLAKADAVLLRLQTGYLAAG
jgi:hypothetical protein